MNDLLPCLAEWNPYLYVSYLPVLPCTTDVLRYSLVHPGREVSNNELLRQYHHVLLQVPGISVEQAKQVIELYPEYEDFQAALMKSSTVPEWSGIESETWKLVKRLRCTILFP